MYVLLYFNIVQIYKETFLKEQLHFILFDLEHFQIYFGRAITFTRKFDRGVVGRQKIDLKLCGRLFLSSWIFSYAAGKKGMCMNF